MLQWELRIEPVLIHGSQKQNWHLYWFEYLLTAPTYYSRLQKRLPQTFSGMHKSDQPTAAHAIRAQIIELPFLWIEAFGEAMRVLVTAMGTI